MLDVHPPHEPVHSWRDFALHILTITIGLLIALGLEAVVERVHRRNEVRETREALSREREENRKRFALDTAYFRRQAATLGNNLLVLAYIQEHPGTPQARLPGYLNWISPNARMTESAWKTAQQTGVLVYMPQEEVQQLSELYDFLERLDAAHEKEAEALLPALQYLLQDPDATHLSTTALDRQIELTRTVLLKHLGYGFLMEDIASNFADFQPAPKRAELLKILHLGQALPPDLRGAWELTQKRVASAVAEAEAESPRPVSDPEK